jgi:hypothetical protein
MSLGRLSRHFVTLYLPITYSKVQKILLFSDVNGLMSSISFNVEPHTRPRCQLDWQDFGLPSEKNKKMGSVRAFSETLWRNRITTVAMQT